MKTHLKSKHMNLQSAMEYLMTYGWAILIIAVVLGALFQLGVFNPMTFAPKAPPGACQVFRPNGPYTTSFINLEGICTGEIPQYVAQFNGQSSEIATAANVNLPATTPETLVVWIYTASYPGSGTPAATNPSVGSVVLQEGTTNNANTYIINYTGHLGIDVWGCGTARSVGTVPLNAWVQVAYVYNALANSLTYYINGRPSGTVTPCGYHSTNNPLVLGYNNIGSSNNAFAGAMADMQLYNISLSANDIQALYLEGIGGAPIDLQNLVGWWPLNGNANDYSGNGNNGQISNVNFVSNWYNGYTPP